MKRLMCAGVVALLGVAPLVAQAPRGWMQRIDRSTNASDPDGAGGVRFVSEGTGFRATNPQAAVFWNPANAASGAYTVKGTFTLIRPSGHTNYYGLVVGGSDLAGPTQNYLYFMVAQDGTWLLKRREGSAEPRDVAPKGSNAAIKRPDASGRSVNVLEVRVAADRLDYVVNGTVVHTTPKTGLTARTDGIYGVRINHLLEVQVDGFSVSKP